MTGSTRPPWWWSRQSRRSLVDAGFEDPAAVEIVEEARDEARGPRLTARLEAGNGGEDAGELGPPRRQLRSEGARLAQVDAIAAVVALAHIVDRNAFWRP